MKKPMILLAALLAFAAPAAAQPEASPGELEAARELLEVSLTAETFVRALELGMAENGAEKLTPAVRQALRDFMAEHFRYEELLPDFVQMYTELFTEEEIRGITAFYRTPAGRRMAEMAPELAIRSQRIVAERLQESMPELMQAIMEAMQADQDKSSDSR
jgi:uncharacterized protein